MGVKIIKPALGIQTITPGHAATLSLDTGPRYFDVLSKITAAGQVLNQIIDKFVVKLNTKAQWEVTPDELDHIYRLMGSNGSTEHAVQNNTAGSEIHVPFWFMEPWRKGFVAQNALVWPTGDIEDGKLIVEYHLKSTADASVDIKTEVQFDNPVDAAGKPLPLGAGAIRKIYRDSVDVTGTAPVYKGLERRDNLQSLHFYDQGTIERLEFMVGTTVVRDILRASNESRLIGRGMTPHNDWFDVVFDDDDDLLSAVPLDGSRTLTVKLTLNDGTPTTIPLVIQKAGPRD